MDLGEKLKHLRKMEGSLKGLGRPMTKAELVRAMLQEQGEAVSHAYLSQIESGARIHLSARTRDLLARFFRVHPGYLVSDPPGFDSAPTTHELVASNDMRGRLLANAETMREDPLVYRSLLRLARHPNPRLCLALLDEVLDLPGDQIRGMVAELRAAKKTRGGDGKPAS